MIFLVESAFACLLQSSDEVNVKFAEVLDQCDQRRNDGTGFVPLAESALKGVL
jgi:hypothetical protein